MRSVLLRSHLSRLSHPLTCGGGRIFLFLHLLDEFLSRQVEQLAQWEVVELSDLLEALCARRLAVALHFVVGWLGYVHEVGQVRLVEAAVVAEAAQLDAEIGEGGSVYETAFVFG